MHKQRVDVSAEMVALVGAGIVARDWPAHWLSLSFDAGSVSTTRDAGDVEEAELVFAVDPAAALRLFDHLPEPEMRWHLPGDVRAMVRAIGECALPEPARATLRLAKSIELLCAIMTRLGAGALVPAEPSGTLSAGDTQRILAARRLIDERWREKLTLDAIARACGLNRVKLTRGFRLLFDCSVADALVEHRLGGARRMLHETDLPVSSIGYACGYLNNASFTRAFSRRYGVAPSRLRQAA